MSRAKMYSSVNANEKSSFARTCNRLGMFLKEKGSLIDLGLNPNFDAIEKRETTVDLLSNMEISPVQTSTKTEKTLNPLPQYVSSDSLFERVVDGLTNKSSDNNESGTKTAPMTIFYGGQVLVFDDISDDKARDVMLLATSGGSIISSKNRIQNQSTSPSNYSTSCDIFGSPDQLNTIPRLEEGLDLPIARRASLHKFLARRKDRATVRPTPYQSRNTSKEASSSTHHKFDLNF
uniref:protein TIFY 10A-like n=1 Tax=Erigeron canadensis TaxID=72917 RepID=UPI001CB95A0A|nr:protein TIFY 10A-like [Erigeron canadensis]